MKILSASETRQLDAFTITHEPITSIDLMERASAAFVRWFAAHYASDCKVNVVCGLGNNGGDGLAIARLLHQKNHPVEVFLIQYADKTSDDFAINRQRLPKNIAVHTIDTPDQVPVFDSSAILIDAIFGSGLSRPVSGLAATVIQAMNANPHIVAVDIPSGLFMDSANADTDVIVQASHTVSFQLPKLAFMLPQNAPFVGEWHVADIGLHPQAIEQAQTRYLYTDDTLAQSLLQKRKKFSHKGTNGHALLIAGSYGMMGAALLASRACLRSGVGKLTLHAPKLANDLIQSTVPEALFSADVHEHFSTTYWTTKSLAHFDSIGLGPGLGTDDEIVLSIQSVIENCEDIPLVIDADGLNNLASTKGRKLVKQLPKNTILTPHPKEFQKLLNRKWENDYEKLELLSEFAVTHQVIVCLKGAHTAVALPNGTVHFNSTGNPGMATGGTGDVLTGIITSLLAQHYPPEHAAIFGVYLHGLAGDKAAQHKSEYALIASDLYEYLPEAFLQLLQAAES